MTARLILIDTLNCFASRFQIVRGQICQKLLAVVLCVRTNAFEISLEEIELPNTHAAEQAMRQSARRRVRNRNIRATARGQTKRATKLIASGSVADAEKATLEAIRALDGAAQKGIIKKNNAARRKSRLMKKLNQLRAAKK